MFKKPPKSSLKNSSLFHPSQSKLFTSNYTNIGQYASIQTWKYIMTMTFIKILEHTRTDV